MSEYGIVPEPSAVADRMAIADLIHGYALHVREGKIDLCADLFVEDGIYEMFGGEPFSGSTPRRLAGRGAIVGYISTSIQGSRGTLPIIHNLLIDLHGDEATAACLVSTIGVATGHELIGEYYDTLRRTDAGWRFAVRRHRIITQRPALRGHDA